jgi:hypothetical protein
MTREKLEKILFFEQTGVFAVLDGASVPDLPLRLYETNTPNYCLFRGELPPDLLYAAPYVATLLPGSPFADWVLDESSGNHWGIFLHCRYSIKEMRRHCRDLFSVCDEKGKPMIFRFYDPRVLRKFMPTCTAEELKSFFGNVDTFFAETEDGKTISAYKLENDQLKQTDLI